MTKSLKANLRKSDGYPIIDKYMVIKYYRSSKGSGVLHGRILLVTNLAQIIKKIMPILDQVTLSKGQLLNRRVKMD